MRFVLPLLLALGAATPAAAGNGSETAPHSAEAPVVWVDTDDGAQVAMQHHAADGPPVILCHGISSNHHFWDLAPDRSLARWLQERGYDVWNLDLRGHGFAVYEQDGDRQSAGWSVDDYGQYDLPAAIDHVRQATGAERVHYVGHSMGGMVLAVYLATHAEVPLASVAVVGSPLDFRDPGLVTRTLLRQGWLGTVLGFTPSQVGANLMAGIEEKAPLHADEYLYNPANIEPEARRLTLRRVVSPLSRGEVAQFRLARVDGEFRSMDGQRVYREHLAHVDVPMLFFAGRADRVVHPDRVRTYYEAVGSPDKELLIASVANGFHGDYGHLDLGVGDHADEDVYARILDWIERHP